MPVIDLTTIPPSRRAKLIRVGRQHGSDDVLDQLHLTANALVTHGPALLAHGWDPSDTAALTDAVETYGPLGVGREGARGARKLTNAELLAASKSGKDQRFSARGVLGGAARRLAHAGDDVSARTIEVVLAQTSRSGADPEELASQLDLLRGLFAVPAVRRAVSDPEAREAELGAAAAAVRTASAAHSHPAGTPEETERLDLLDGYVIELVRAARAAARAAARMTGQESIAKAFELTALYRTAPRRPAPTPPSGG